MEPFYSWWGWVDNTTLDHTWYKCNLFDEKRRCSMEFIMIVSYSRWEHWPEKKDEYLRQQNCCYHIHSSIKSNKMVWKTVNIAALFFFFNKKLKFLHQSIFFLCVEKSMNRQFQRVFWGGGGLLVGRNVWVLPQNRVWCTQEKVE